MLNQILRAATKKSQVGTRWLSSGTQKFLVVNAVGLDRPGIVSDLTNVVVKAGGNVGESRALTLGDHFSLMMLVSIPESKDSEVKESFSGIKDLHTNTFDTSDPKATIIASPEIGYEGRITLTGANHPGIVHSVTSLLAKHMLSVSNLSTSEDDEAAPFGGTTLFTMNCTVSASNLSNKNFDVELLEKEIENLANDLNCDIDLEHD
eukprot:CAMPEP_0178959346 /NCGR_PEP_ID=MMETSP0789-20121207/12239_1 /TAXON_ID=3005 /ORGANISM="Rhizosolenia setigera, Strain CCMP 1694" /LENGTH=205 /DNA_ID=CAMNT_0020642337 /DNA_START=79 /DNA_END=696 /DNA_ORIENTATION=+